MNQPPREKRRELRRPELPTVTRINRNVLLVAGMFVAVVVLTVTHVARSSPRGGVRDVGAPRVEPGAVADFLRTPPREPVAPPVPPPAFPDVQPDDVTVGLAGGMYGPDAPPPLEPPIWGSTSYAPISMPDPGDLALERAHHAGLRSGSQGPGSAFAGGTRPSSGGAFAPGPTGPARPADLEWGNEASLFPSEDRDFVSASRDTEPTLYVSSGLVEPVSEYQIMAGTVLPAMMVTNMNSQMPGEVVAQISRHVYDSQQRHLIIPRGTRLIGRYDNQVALGQSRVLVAWTRLIFPDGRSLSVPGLPTMDLRGASGVRSRVDNHYGRLYGQAMLLSIVGAGAQLSQPQPSSVLTPPTAGQVAAGALGQQFSQVSMETIRRNMDVRPTLEVRAGTPFYVFLGRDLVLP